MIRNLCTFLTLVSSLWTLRLLTHWPKPEPAPEHPFVNVHRDKKTGVIKGTTEFYPGTDKGTTFGLLRDETGKVTGTMEATPSETVWRDATGRIYLKTSNK